MTSTSATDPKFLVRFTGCGEMHEKAKAEAKAAHIPLNSFILQAVSEKLNRGKIMDDMMCKFEASVNALVEQEVLAPDRGANQKSHKYLT